VRPYLRTGRSLRSLRGRWGVKGAVIREGLYSESWPLCFGCFDLKGEEGEGVCGGGRWEGELDGVGGFERVGRR
jgi:hypothetical protein